MHVGVCTFRNQTPLITSLSFIDPLHSHHPQPATSTTSSLWWGSLCEGGVAFMLWCIRCIRAVVAVGDEAESQGHTDATECLKVVGEER